MSYETFQQAFMTAWQTYFVTYLPAFPLTNVLYKADRLPPAGETYIDVVYAELEGNYEAIGKLTTQTVLFTVDIFVPPDTDPIEALEVADGVRSVLQWLALPNSARRRKLSKRDFPNSLGGYVHTRIALELLYDVKD